MGTSGISTRRCSDVTANALICPARTAPIFDATFDSFAVSTKVQRAKELVSRYRIPETPTVVVNGKYLTRAALAQGYDRWFAIIEELAATERSAAAE